MPWAHKRPPPSPIVAPPADAAAESWPVAAAGPPAKVAKLAHRPDEDEEGRPEPAGAAVPWPDLHDADACPLDADAADGDLDPAHDVAAEAEARTPAVTLEEPRLPLPALPPLPAARPDGPAAEEDAATQDGAAATAALGREHAGEGERAATTTDEALAAKSGAAPVNAGEDAAASPNDEGVAIETANNEASAATVVKVEVADIGMRQLDETATGVVAAEPPAKKAKKARKEFTAHEKLKILAELNGPHAPPVSSVLEKYGVSKSSLHRWRQPDKMDRLQEMAGGAPAAGAAGDFVDTSKKRDLNDKLRKVKLGLRAFCAKNLARDEDQRLAITSGLIQRKAREIVDELLRRHAEAPGLLADEEAAALGAFRGSKSWACLVGNRLGYLSAAPRAWTAGERENTEAYLARHARRPARPKKRRMEFTAQEKLAILTEFEGANARQRAAGAPPLTVDKLCQKYHTSKSSFHRWKQQADRLREFAKAGSGYSQAKRVFTDKLHAIKRVLNDFYVENEDAPAARRVPITYATLQARALVAREEILQRHLRTAAAAAAAALEGNEGAGAHKATVEDREGTLPPEEQVGEGTEVAEVKASEGAEQAEVEAGEGAPQVEVEIEAGEGAAEVQVGEGAPQVKVSESTPQAGTKSGEFAPVLKVQVDEGQKGGEGRVVKGEDGSEQTESAPGGSGHGTALSKEEVHALQNFKASNSWLRETAKKFGWKLDGPIDTVFNDPAAPVEAAAAYPPPAPPPRAEYAAAEQGPPGAEHRGAPDLAVALVGGGGHHGHGPHGAVGGPLLAHHARPPRPPSQDPVFAPAAYVARGPVLVDILEEPLARAESYNASVGV